MFGPPVPSSGPLDAKVAILAEAPGTEESERGEPLVGPSGHELRRMLTTIGVNLKDCRKVNVFSRQPEGNNLALYGGGPPDPRGPLTLNPITYLDPVHEPDVQRALAELRALAPNIIIALGNTACWALGLGNGIKNLRGSIHRVQLGDREVKVLPTYHPSAVLREWSLRSIAIADLEKAFANSLVPHFQYDNTTLWLQPTIADLVEFDEGYMQRASICACDIETKRGQITCISFAPTVDDSFVIPFWIEADNPNYWENIEDELIAWSYVRRWMERSDLTKVFQNGLYDLTYLMAYCNPTACSEDTMLAHHSLYSELQKGLGFLGSVYTNTPSWKQMRTAKKEEQLKRDD